MTLLPALQLNCLYLLPASGAARGVIYKVCGHFCCQTLQLYQFSLALNL